MAISFEESVGRAMLVITNHIGEHNAISMPEYFTQIYGVAPKSRINGTRRLRVLVDYLVRVKKQRICSTTRGGGGYFLGTAQECRKYADRLRGKALKELHKGAVIRGQTLLEEAGQLVLELRSTGETPVPLDACATDGG